MEMTMQSNFASDQSTGFAANDGTFRQAITHRERQVLLDELYGLHSDMRETDSEIEALQAQKTLIRSRMSELVYRLGEKAELPNIARFRLSGPVERVSYERKTIEQVIARLRADGLDMYAQALADARKTSETAGGLVVSPIKPKAVKEHDDANDAS
jgi:hypothetical protein